MDVKEKLIKLLRVARCPSNGCDFCDYVDFEDCRPRFLADYLIANGVTVQGGDGCEYCEEYEDLPEHFVSGKPVGRIFDTCIQTDENGIWHIELPSGVDIGIKFCPICGRRLPQSTEGE